MNSQFTKVGLPILILLVGGSFGLSYMVQGRFAMGPKIKSDKSNKYKKEEAEFNLDQELQVIPSHTN
jgi:hypothetical protein